MLFSEGGNHLSLGHHDPAETALLLGGIFLVVCVLASKISKRFGVPTLVIFIAIGMLAGSEGPGGISFDNFAITKQFGMILLAFILFAGGMDTSWNQLRPVAWKGLSLATVGVLCTTGLVAVFAYYALHLRPIEGMLLGSIVASTDAAAVFSSLKGGSGIQLKDNLGELIELESGTNDPVAVFLTAALTEIAIHPQTSVVQMLPGMLLQMPIGLAVGFFIGKGAVWLINRVHLEFDGLYPVLTLASAGITYGASVLVGGNAFIAVYTTGVILGSSVFVHKVSLKHFHDGIAWLLQIVVFLALGLLVFPSTVLPIVLLGISFALFLIFVARPVAVFLCLSLTKLSTKSKLLVSWAGLRGAFPIILATFPVLAGLPSGHFIFNLVFFVVVVSVLIQGTTLPFVARFLGVVKENPMSSGSELQPFVEMLELNLGPTAPATGCRVIDLRLPSTSLIVLLRRSGENYTPTGSTTLLEGDTLFVATRKEDHDELRLKLTGEQSVGSEAQLEPVV